MRSICFFSSYFPGEKVPEYIKFYLNELVRHFSEVVYITTEKVITDSDAGFLKEKNIRLMLVRNEGYDFGMWHKGLNSIDTSIYDRIGLVNDSCILFNKLDDFFAWVNNGAYDYCGFTENNAPRYHLQSYFLVVNKRAIAMLKEYLDKNGPKPTLKEVIITYELGLSDYMLKAAMNVAAYYKAINRFGDPTWVRAKELISNGYPLIKKRIIARNYGEAEFEGLILIGFDPYPAHYIKLIEKITGDQAIENMFLELQAKWNIFSEIKFRIIATSVYAYRCLKQLKQSVTKPGKA
jgi:lipopolysaccharide biosynthesis protein